MPIASAKRSSIKSEAIRLLRRLPAKASWDDVMYRIYVRQKIDAGLADLKAGRTHSHASIRREFSVT